ncbi:MAG TPA: DUF3307 domain-containing protein [Flavobacteriales bacterium]|jgi:hypothetical protein|nr:DUF3307 domain-containing protein [Flavobacteriales bacterium]
MTVFLLKLILAHLIGDFLLQFRSWVQKKEEKKGASPILYIHVLIHGLLVLLLLGIEYWPLAALVTLGHLIIDLMKLYLQKPATKTLWFIGDQILHFALLILLWYLWFSPELSFAGMLESELLLVYLIAVLFLTQPMAITLYVVMKPWSDLISGHSDESLENAGRSIGILERLLVFSFIVLQQWEAVGFLLAAKSVFRFGDLRETQSRKLTEYILIGTLLSFGIAILVGALVSNFYPLS